MRQNADFPEDMIFNFLNQVKELTLSLNISNQKKSELLKSLDQLISYYKDVNE